MGKESAKKIMADIMANSPEFAAISELMSNSPEFAAQMEAARKVETGESDKPVIVKLTGRFDNPQITNETMAEKPIDVINRLSGRDKIIPPLHGTELSALHALENKYDQALSDIFKELYTWEMEEDEMDSVMEEFINRLPDMREEWDDYKDNVEDEVPGQEIRDYPQSFLE